MSRPTDIAAVVSNIKPLDNKKLRAFFSIELPSGTIINSCILKYSPDRRAFSVAPPQIPLLTETGAIARDRHGEVVFQAALSFRKATTRQHFEATALRALRQQAPELFTLDTRLYNQQK